MKGIPGGLVLLGALALILILRSAVTRADASR